MDKQTIPYITIVAIVAIVAIFSMLQSPATVQSPAVIAPTGAPGVSGSGDLVGQATAFGPSDEFIKNMFDAAQASIEKERVNRGLYKTWAYYHDTDNEHGGASHVWIADNGGVESLAGMTTWSDNAKSAYIRGAWAYHSNSKKWIQLNGWVSVYEANYYHVSDSLSLNQEVSLVRNGNEYDVKIIDGSVRNNAIKLTVNGKETPWLKERDSHTTDGMKFYIQNIFVSDAPTKTVSANVVFHND